MSGPTQVPEEQPQAKQKQHPGQPKSKQSSRRGNQIEASGLACSVSRTTFYRNLQFM